MVNKFEDIHKTKFRFSKFSNCIQLVLDLGITMSIHCCTVYTSCICGHLTYNDTNLYANFK